MKQFNLTAATLLLLVALSGCNGRGFHGAQRTRLGPLDDVVARAKPVPLPLDSTPRADLVVVSLRKRVLGRENSQRDIYRVANEIDPIVTQAVDQKEVQANLKKLADALGSTVKKTRESWIALQDADIMIESGGDPDAVSSAGAVGVAQWMPVSGAKAGLAVNVKAAEQFTPQITELERQIAWLEYLRQPHPNMSAPGVPNIKPADIAPTLASRNLDLETLRQKRAVLDERYDARKAIFAQTRYLLGIAGKYPSPSWLFQAYHGGEGGVNETLKTWCGDSWPGSPARAITAGAGANGKPPLTFESVYFGATPKSHVAAFNYLFARGDDHRHYWWKLKVAAQGLDLYHRNTSESAAECKALFPGSPAPMIWYGKDHPPLRNLDDLRACVGTHDLVEVTPDADIMPVLTIDDAVHARSYAVLRPSAWGALALIAHMYRSCGGSSQLKISDLTRTDELNKTRDARLAAAALAVKPKDTGPPWPPSPNPVHDQFDYHTIGVEFDIDQPNDNEDRKILDFCTGYLEDRGIIMRFQEKDQGVWHVVPNPRYSTALDDISRSGMPPQIKGI